MRRPGVAQSGSFDVWWDAQGQRILRYVIKESQVLTVGGKLRQDRISTVPYKAVALSWHSVRGEGMPAGLP